MICFSQLQRVPILDNQEKLIGRLRDVVIKINNETKNDYPEILGIICTLEKKTAYIPYQYLENFGPGEISLKSANCWQTDYKFSDNDIFLRRDLLDQQIVDVEGIRVVRVNDLQLIKIDDRFYLVSIDISAKGLLRRLGIAHWPFFRNIQAQCINWHKVTFVKDSVGSLKLKTTSSKLEKLHPADIANLIENLTLQQSSKLVQSFDKETAAEILGEIDPEYKKSLLEQISPKKLADIIEEMPIDEAVAVIRKLKEQNKKQIINRLGKDKAKKISQLSTYDEDMAGGLMTSEYIAVPENYTATEVIHDIRQKSDDHRFIYHIFVRNDKQQLRGIVSMRTLLLASPDNTMANIMSPIHKTVRSGTKIKDVARLMTKYNLLSIAVTDKQKKIHGIITVDDIMRFLIPNA